MYSGVIFNTVLKTVVREVTCDVYRFTRNALVKQGKKFAKKMPENLVINGE